MLVGGGGSCGVLHARHHISTRNFFETEFEEGSCAFAAAAAVDAAWTPLASARPSEVAVLAAAPQRKA